MISPLLANRLRTTTPGTIVREHGERTRRAFRSDGVPVVIAARNEEHDLPGTLFALSRSEVSVAPIVVVNGTTDNTAEIANDMGARVIECGVPFKLAALQLATQIIHGEQSDRAILYTDADTLVGIGWAGSMSDAFSRDGGVDEVVLGEVGLHMGPSTLIDVARSFRLLVKNRVKKTVGPVGSNMGLRFVSSDVLKAYMDLPPQLFINEEQAIVDVFSGHGGRVTPNIGIAALALTRNDRYPLGALIGIRQISDVHDRNQRIAALYPQYTGIQPYDK